MRATEARALRYHRVSGVRVREWRLDHRGVSPRPRPPNPSLRGNVEFVFVRHLWRRLRAAPRPRPPLCPTFTTATRISATKWRRSAEARRRRYTVRGQRLRGPWEPMPFDKWGTGPEQYASGSVASDPRPSLDECGSRSGRNWRRSARDLNAATTSADQLTNEAGERRRLLLQRLGTEHADRTHTCMAAPSGPGVAGLRGGDDGRLTRRP